MWNDVKSLTGVRLSWGGDRWGTWQDYWEEGSDLSFLFYTWQVSTFHWTVFHWGDLDFSWEIATKHPWGNEWDVLPNEPRITGITRGGLVMIETWLLLSSTLCQDWRWWGALQNSTPKCDLALIGQVFFLILCLWSMGDTHPRNMWLTIKDYVGKHG